MRADATRALAVFVAFAAFAVLSWESFGSLEGSSFFYPAAGVTVAAMIVSRRGSWPAIALAIIAAEILVDTVYGSPLWVAAGFAMANVVEPMLGASLVLAWCGARPDLHDRRDFAGFMAGACVIAPLFGALLGGTVTALHYGAPWLGGAVTWWAGDALGVLVMGSPILLWSQSAAVRCAICGRRLESAPMSPKTAHQDSANSRPVFAPSTGQILPFPVAACRNLFK